MRTSKVFLKTVSVVMLLALSACGGNSGGNGDSDSDTAPAAPGGLSGTGISDGAITLTWTDVSNEQSYNLQRSSTTGSGFLTIANPAADTTSFTDTGLIPSTTYFYRVRAENNAGNSNFSSETNASTTAHSLSPPAAPSGLDATAISPISINLSWTDNSHNETFFNLLRSIKPTTGFGILANLPANTTSYTDSGLKNAVTYYYRVLANNSAGDSGFTAANATTLGSPVSPLNAPSNLVATSGSSSEITLSWTDNSSDNTGFTIERSSSPNSGFGNAVTIGDTTTYRATGLAPSTSYYFRVKAYKGAVESDYSNTANATTLVTQLNYIFPGGSLADLEAVSASLTFDNLTINGSLIIPSTESNVVFKVVNFTINAITGSGISIDHPNCVYRHAPNLTINASGTVTLNDSVDMSGKNGTATTTTATCLSAKGTDGGNVTINANTISVNAGIDTNGGHSRNESTFIGGTLFRFASDGADAGNISLNGSNSLALTASAKLSTEGGSGGVSTPAGNDGDDGADGLLSWNGSPITVAEIDSLNALTHNGQLVPYTAMTINGNVGNADDSTYRGSTTSGWCQINYPTGFSDFVEDWYQVERTGLGTIKATTDASSDIDIFLLDFCGGSIIAQGNGATGSETLTSPLLAAGVYLLGVSYADDAPPGSTTYTLILGN